MANKQEFVEVEAEVIENEMMPAGTLDIDMSGILADLGTLAEEIDGALTVYGEMLVERDVIESMDYADIKRCEQSLSTAMKPADEARKKFNADYKKPIDEVKARYDELMNPIKELHSVYKEVRVAKDDEAKELRRQGLEGTYLDFCEMNGMSALPDVVPFDRLLADNPKWLNKSTNAAKAAEEVEGIASRLAKDWGTLTKNRSKLKFWDEAEAEFFRTLDVTAALELDARRAEEQERINALKAERGQVEEYRETPQERPQEPSQEPVERRPYVIHIDLTEAEKQALVRFIQQNEIGANRAIGIAKEQ